MVLTGGSVEAVLPDGRHVVADIARGASEGSVLVLPPEKCGTEGPVELTVAYARSDTFWCVGADLHTSLAIGLETAVLGGQRSLDTLDGAIRITVPAWSGSETGRCASATAACPGRRTTAAATCSCIYGW